MWNSRNYHEKLLEGWERSETSNGIPYYVNHKSEVTQWDHPFLLKTLEEIGDYDGVKYAAYRTAMKLRFIQKRLNLELVSLDSITRIFKQRGHHGPSEGQLDCMELENLLLDIMFEAARTDHTRRVNAEQAAELLLNWLLNIYDQNRSGQVRCLSIKVGLAVLSSARLSEKYRFFFQQISDHNGFASRKKMALFLHDVMQVAETVHEGESFGCQHVPSSVESSLERAMNSQGVSQDVFLDWMFREPQTVIWLPTMHRMAAAESVKHESKCNICKAFPIIGFRYRCLKCFNFDLCQQCFLTGRVTKKHKSRHPTQEYCVAAGAKDDRKAFVKTVKNNLSKKSKEKSKRPRYLSVNRGSEYDQGPTDRFSPAPPEPNIHRMLSKAARQLAHNEQLAPPGRVSKVVQTDGVGQADSAEERENLQNLHVQLDSDELKEREDIIKNLENENSELLHEIERLQNNLASGSSQSESDTGSDGDLIREERLKVERGILTEHNQQLQRQLDRMRARLAGRRDKDEVDGTLGSHRVVNDLSRQPVPTTSLPPFNPTSHPQVRPVVPEIARVRAQHQVTTPAQIATRLQSTPQSRLPPPPPPMHDLSSFYSNSPLVIPLTEARPPVANIPSIRFDLEESVLPTNQRRLPSKLPNSEANQPDLNFSQYPWDNRSDWSHFSLPSREQSTRVSDEQAELDEMLQRLQATYPASMSAHARTTSPMDSNEVFSAANRLGAAMSNFVGNMAS